MDLADALASLDPENDDHWTQDGSPKLETISALVGEKVSRGAITKAFPNLDRDAARDAAAKAAEEAAAAAAAAPDEPDEPSVEEEVDELQMAVEEAEARMHECRAALDKAQKEMGQAQVEFEKILVEYDKSHPPMSNQEKIMEYLEGQKLERARRAGISAALLHRAAREVTQAPIDRAYAAKRSRFGKRPVRPMVGRQG